MLSTALHGYSLYVPMTADISSLVILLDGLPGFASIGIVFAGFASAGIGIP